MQKLMMSKTKSILECDNRNSRTGIDIRADSISVHIKVYNI